MSKLSFAMNKQGPRRRRGKVLSAFMSGALVLGLLPVTALGAGAVPAYADEGGGLAYEPISQIVQKGLDRSLVPETGQPLTGLFSLFRSGGDEPLSQTDLTLVVKQTLLLADQVAEGESFDTLKADQEHFADAYLAQFQETATVYDPGRASDYYVAYVGGVEMTSPADVIDWQAAYYDTGARMAEGVSYDAETGIAYLPKSLWDSAEAGQQQEALQIQLLVSYDPAGEKPRIDVEIDNGAGNVTAVAGEQNIAADPFDMSVDIPVATPETAHEVALGDLSVYLNGSERPVELIEGETAEWNSETGVLTLAATGTQIVSVRVEIGARAWWEPEPAYAVSAASMSCLHDKDGNESVLTKFNPDKAVEWTKAYKYRSAGYYNTTTSVPWKLQVADTLWDCIYVGNIHSKVNSGSGTAQGVLDSIRKPSGSAGLGDANDLINCTFDWPDHNRKGGTPDGSDNLPPQSGDPVIGGIDWTGFPATAVNDDDEPLYRGMAQCSHIGTVDGNSFQGSQESGYWWFTCTMRILKVADDYVVLSFFIPTFSDSSVSTGQSGAAVYKIKYEAPQGQAKVKKASSDEGISGNNRCYSYKNAVFAAVADSDYADKMLGYAQAGTWSTWKDARDWALDRVDSGKVEAVFVTDEAGESKVKKLDTGDYRLVELYAPKGYKVASKHVKLAVEPGKDNTAVVEVANEPLNDPAGIMVRKYDAGSGDFVATGDAKLGLAEYTYEYVDGYATTSAQFDQLKASSAAKRTWVMRTDGNGLTDIRKGSDTFEFNGKTYNYKASGDSFFKADGRITLPLGTVRIRETKAPEGYNLSDRVYLVRVVADPTSLAGTKLEGDTGLIQDGNTATEATRAEEQPARGGVTIYKLDAETGSSRPLAGASWDGVAFEIVNKSEAPVTYKGVKVPVDGVVDVIKPASQDGKATTGPNVLQYGTYSIREVSTSDAYLMTDTKERTFQIRSDGQMVVFDGNNDAAENEPKRGDIEFVKVGEGASPRLANVPFLVTNKASGEAHVVVTDANGQMKTSSDWNKHTVRTNASDAAVDADGDGVFTDEEKAAVDESKLDCNAGTWFGLNPDTGKLVPASDGKGALRWGDYTVEELRVGANKGYELVKMDISVRRHGVTIDMGTIVDEKPYVKTPWIGTSARDGADGDRILVADPEAVVVDRVEYANLEAGELYRVVGVLMDKAAGEPVRDAQGNPVTAEKSFVAEDVKGYVELAFGFDATSVEGDVVVFEALYKDGSDEPVAKHEDIDDYYQTVKVYEPSIGTTLLDGLDGDKTVVADDTVTLVDTVAYRNMPVGKECTVTGTLMVAGEEPAPLMRPVLDESGAPVLDEAGQPLTEPVTATATFTPAEPDGTVEVAFVFPGDVIEADMALVAYERVLRLDTEVASHEDPEDPSQTVVVVTPEIGTLATDAKDGDKEIEAAASVTINDAVRYENLVPGREHTLDLTVMQVTDGGAVPLNDAEGKPYTVRHAFVPEASSGIEVVSVTIDSTDLAGSDLVMFEVLSIDGKVIASHEDPDDEGQTVHVTEPKIGTTATDKTDGDHKILASRSAVVVDEVAYTGLVPGEEHVLKAVLMDKATGKPVIAGDREVRAELRFTPNAPEGTVSIELSFDASALGGKQLVVFEELYKNGEPVAEHKDIDDAAQTVEVVTPLSQTGQPSETPSGTPYAKTGVDTAAPVAAALALVLVAATALAVTRRRKHAAAIEDIEAGAVGGQDD